MAALEPEHVGGKATAEGGLVLLDGPNGVAITMTADAARATGQSLIDAADASVRQSAEHAQK